MTARGKAPGSRTRFLADPKGVPATKYYYDLHLHSCLSPHPALPGGGPGF